MSVALLKRITLDAEEEEALRYLSSVNCIFRKTRVNCILVKQRIAFIVDCDAQGNQNFGTHRE